MPAKLKVIRAISYLFLAGITAMWFFDNFFAGYVNWVMIALTSLFVLQLLLGIKYVDKVLGIIMTIGTFYMLMAVCVSLNKIPGKATSAEIRSFFTGLGIFTLGLIASLFITYYYYAKRRLAGSTKDI